MTSTMEEISIYEEKKEKTKEYFEYIVIQPSDNPNCPENFKIKKIGKYFQNIDEFESDFLVYLFGERLRSDIKQLDIDDDTKLLGIKARHYYIDDDDSIPNKFATDLHRKDYKDAHVSLSFPVFKTSPYPVIIRGTSVIVKKDVLPFTEDETEEFKKQFDICSVRYEMTTMYMKLGNIALCVSCPCVGFGMCVVWFLNLIGIKPPEEK